MSGDHRNVERWWWAVLAVITLAAVSSCNGGDDGAAGAVGAAGYTAVIDDFLPPPRADGERPVVFVARLGEDPFALDDQVAMIEAVAESHDLRFVDDIAAAVDDEDSDAPPREDGVVVGIGTISAARPHVVRVEVYRAAGVIEAHKVTLTVRNGVWRVDTNESIDPEVLVGDE